MCHKTISRGNNDAKSRHAVTWHKDDKSYDYDKYILPMNHKHVVDIMKTIKDVTPVTQVLEPHLMDVTSVRMRERERGEEVKEMEQERREVDDDAVRKVELGEEVRVSDEQKILGGS